MNKPKIELATIPVSPDDISTNLQVGVIVVSEDKLIRILEKDRERTKKNMVWTAPASFFITLIVAILTTDFKSRWGMPAEAWQALFYLGTGLSAIFAAIYWYKVDRKDMDKLIEEIKGK
ncbi:MULTISPECIES: hypothetical protein [Citrobacter]|uniref:hypothetical protein n=1 Tax=Citrobacter TaxID=544 RepID=UPI000FD822CD|nr:MULTISPECIES: hypothetical protein [Citrobacter]MCU0187317.1 hypothetical protein [Citrobacter freundii]MDM2823627.1 hypothetical protein [Citrobacter sp. Cpo100]RVR87886.1 hypothetical protein EOL20_26460 [Citrobacter freundii]